MPSLQAEDGTNRHAGSINAINEDEAGGSTSTRYTDERSAAKPLTHSRVQRVHIQLSTTTICDSTHSVILCTLPTSSSSRKGRNTTTRNVTLRIVWSAGVGGPRLGACHCRHALCTVSLPLHYIRCDCMAALLSAFPAVCFPLHVIIPLKGRVWCQPTMGSANALSMAAALTCSVRRHPSDRRSPPRWTGCRTK